MRDSFYLTDEQRQVRDLVRTVARERIAPLAAQVDETDTYPADQLRRLGEAFSLSGPGAGSDAASLTTTAVRRGDRYLLNGTKAWVTNGSHASVLTLFATMDQGRGRHGVTGFLVEPTFPGFALGKLERKMGVRGSPTVAIHLSDCEVPVENRLGNEGEGFRVALGALDRSRPAVGAQAVGIAQAALDAAVGYAKERR